MKEKDQKRGHTLSFNVYKTRENAILTVETESRKVVALGWGEGHQRKGPHRSARKLLG